MLNNFGIDKLHGFMMHSVMLAIGRISCENDYSFQFSNVDCYVSVVYFVSIYLYLSTSQCLQKTGFYVIILR